MIERTIVAEGPGSVAAIVVEPVIHLAGMAVAPKQYFQQLRQICDRHDVLLVFDEIVTGFGRTGEKFAADLLGVTPDIMCVGKGISGGYAPLAGVLMTDRVSGVLREKDTDLAWMAPSHTYAANPVSAAAGRAALRLFRDEDYCARVRDLGAYLRDQLIAAVDGRGRLQGVGLLFGIKLDPPPGLSAEQFRAQEPGLRIRRFCLDHGVVLRGESDWVVMAPAFIATKADLDEICATLKSALDEVYSHSTMFAGVAV